MDSDKYFLYFIKSLDKKGKSTIDYIHRVSYMMQERFNIDFGFKYEIYHYSPYSFCLKERFNKLLASGKIKRCTNFYLVEPSKQFCTYYTEENIDIDNKASDAIDKAVNRLAKMEIKELDIICTLIFINSKVKDRGTATRRIMELKRHLTINEINHAFRDLKYIDACSIGMFL